MACGFSRDDSASFLEPYVNDPDKGFYDYDPFETMDFDGVGKLVRMASDLGRTANSDLVLGICGEHGGDRRRSSSSTKSDSTTSPVPLPAFPSPAWRRQGSSKVASSGFGRDSSPGRMAPSMDKDKKGNDTEVKARQGDDQRATEGADDLSEISPSLRSRRGELEGTKAAEHKGKYSIGEMYQAMIDY